jgi:NAD-dependent dihydropyrimidine dehydrogenase PreA subunit
MKPTIRLRNGGIKMEKKIYAEPNLITPNKPVVIDPDVCTGCNLCMEACMNDVMVPNSKKGEPPIALYPDECWYCGCCVMECPLKDKGAIKLEWPMMQKIRWKRADTGEHFRLGMPDPPPPNTRPPV